MAMVAPLAASGAEAVAGGTAAVAAEASGGAAAGGAAAGTGARGAGGAGRAGGKGKPARSPRAARPTSSTSSTAPAAANLDPSQVVLEEAGDVADEPAPAPDNSLGSSTDSPTQALAKATKRVQPGQQVAGGLLAALVVYPVLLNFLKGGTPQVKKWARAKFFNGAAVGSDIGSQPQTRLRHGQQDLSQPTSASTGTQATGPPASGAAATAIAFARAQIGDPYFWGGNGPDRWDCSGLTRAAYAAAGIKIPPTTAGQIFAGKRVARADLQPGDLVFPLSTHVGIYTGAGKVVEAPRTGLEVREVPIWGFVTARRVSGA